MPDDAGNDLASSRAAAVGLRALGLLILVVITWKVLARGMSPAVAGLVLTIVDGANLVFHEAGHFLFMFFGDFLHALGGSATQLMMPAVCVGYFLYHAQYASAAVATFWLGESLTGVGVYIADAKRMQLPLFGEIHDWHYLLGRLGWLDHASTLGGLIFAAGVLTMFAALGLLALDLLRIANAGEPAEERV